MSATAAAMRGTYAQRSADTIAAVLDVGGLVFFVAAVCAVLVSIWVEVGQMSRDQTAADPTGVVPAPGMPNDPNRVALLDRWR